MALPQSHGEASSRTGTRRLMLWAAGLSIGALLAHAIDTPDHLKEWWVYSSIFITISAFQFFYGFGLFLQPWRYDETGALKKNADMSGRSYYMLGIVLTALDIVLYIVTRTSGMPFLGPDAVAEKVTVLSLLPSLEGIPLLYCLVRLVIGTFPSKNKIK